jgi:ElaB/YqjD/DUF883 family membrane-anchored ribosome-binding protein
MVEDRTMAEQRTPRSSDASPAQESSIQGRDTAQEVRAPVSETARQVGESASAYYEQGREKVEVYQQYLEENIREKPLPSVLMAVGLGMLIGLLWKR